MIKVALIGCGEMGRTHATCLARLPGVKLLACCDIDVSKAQELCHNFSVDRYCSDSGDIFRDPEVDAVYVLSRTDAHFADCLQTLQSGKHLFIEKPLALDLDQAQQIARAARRTDRLVMVGFKFRFYRLIERARRCVGKPYLAAVQILDDPWPADFWANQQDKGGGNVISQGVHGADLLRYLLQSEPTAVYAVGGNYHQKTGVVDNLNAVFRFANGSSGSLVVGDCGRAVLQGKFSCNLAGEAGTVDLDQRFTRLGIQLRDGTLRIENGEEDGFFLENQAFIEAIDKKLASPCAVENGVMAQAMIKAAIDSAQHDAVVEISRDLSGSVNLHSRTY
ncbi:MAG TPA: Gfo/Idh/MocA family oxidoreductase [bacterium]|nr:Gfo/Idh/MocA family oxidoreductase [bacterium]HNT65020.1 Gfo/Idh/MocA family oxidoreductase [bacterium]HOX84427.1 Gfo/Idh/MocA family oxidoreductase [bacterium]HPG45976.1 Gfo/Idh/MocA family oxidoreductase [bacterium]HPM97798.1 Gfo/Idh/MocA family oxidoreductase [bacterium]